MPSTISRTYKPAFGLLFMRMLSDSSINLSGLSVVRWWRRAALVSTVALSRRGDTKALAKVARICTLLVSDRDDMVVKALSWALREMAKKHPVEASKFLAEHQHAIAARHPGSEQQACDRPENPSSPPDQSSQGVSEWGRTANWRGVRCFGRDPAGIRVGRLLCYRLSWIS
jgi:hypothetical protein